MRIMVSTSRCYVDEIGEIVLYLTKIYMSVNYAHDMV